MAHGRGVSSRAHALGAALLAAGCHTRTPTPHVALPVVDARPVATQAPPAARSTSFPDADVDAAVESAIDSHQIPGAVVIVGRRDGIVFRRAYGFREVEPSRVPMTVDTLFDLASLTKPVATATSIMVLVERGAVGLDEPLAKYVPECAKNGKSAVTIRQLLLHVSGLQADTPEGDFAQGRGEAIRRICNLSLRATPGSGTIYSDLGFILLEEVVRRVASRDLPGFSDEAIFTPLGMKETGFLPSDTLKQRAAWTEFVEGAWRVGVVHDPRAYLLGGVAGHAGLFSTADDLALYARAILGGGAIDTKRILSPQAVASMIAPHDVPGGIRALGWSVGSQWRGEGLSPRAFGHFGFTGTALWMDPDKDLFTVVLTNRVHPDGKGDAKPLVARINTLAARSIGPAAGRVDACPDVTQDTRTGIDVLRDEGFARLRDSHVGLITNATARARDGASTIDLLLNAQGVTLIALFAPEHGLDADREGKIKGGREPRTGLPVHSLYGDALGPSPQSLEGIDTLVFDIQDAGTRFFTYASTMRRAMEVARDHGLRFVVLDRPNPIDGIDIDGPVLVPFPQSFVNYHSLPIRHGMTIGELATLLNADDHLGVALSIVPMRGWRRSLYADETGVRWVNPSPNLRSVDEALLYPAVGLLEATNLSVGRGTDMPFERVGAPWINGRELAAAVTADVLHGVSFTSETFTPTSDRYAHELCGGVRVTVHDRAQFEPVRTGLAIARELRRLYPREWEFEKLGRLLANTEAMSAIGAGLSLASIVMTYRAELAAFAVKRQKYLLYGTGECPPVAPFY
ncbi:MAG: DUF1343 domain-containing protein [Myxococcota bacterium]|nr:DUF1343 domain-containing protein [Myxococcota bacterium]